MGIGNISFDKYTIANSGKTAKQQLPIDAVDKLADELCVEYDNHKYRAWYCKVIYEFGFTRVQEWRGRASEAREPGKVFSKYVSEARTYNQRGSP